MDKFVYEPLKFNFYHYIEINYSSKINFKTLFYARLFKDSAFFLLLTFKFYLAIWCMSFKSYLFIINYIELFENGFIELGGRSP